MKKKVKNGKNPKKADAIKKRTAVDLKRIKTPKVKLKPRKKVKRGPRVKAPDPREVGLIDAIIEGYCEVEDLAQAMRDWADNMEEKFSSTQKYETVSSSADTLEGITDETNAEDAKMLNGFKITIQDHAPTKAWLKRSRATRSSEVVQLWQMCLEKLEEIRDSKDPAIEQGAKDHASSVYDDLDNHIQELEGVEYPGMYG